MAAEQEAMREGHVDAKMVVCLGAAAAGLRAHLEEAGVESTAGSTRDCMWEGRDILTPDLCIMTASAHHGTS